MPVTITHTIEEIERELACGNVPHTDNRDALLALGFSPHRPQDPKDSTWSRAISADARNGYRRQIIQCAEFVADRQVISKG